MHCSNFPLRQPAAIKVHVGRNHRELLSAVLVLCSFIAAPAVADEPVRLTNDGRQKSSPVFRNGDKELVYTDFADATLFQLRRLVLADGTTEHLHSQPTSAEFEPAWSADGEVYAHLKLRGVLSIGIVVRDRQGTTLHEIAPGGGFNGYRSPAIAPDHSRLLFSYAERGSQQIWSSQLNGEDRKPLTETTGINNWPAFSRDGRQIVFSSSRHDDFEVYSMNSDGSAVRRLTNSPGQDIRPRFSPDGKRIAFTSHRDGNAEIYVMDSDGSNPRRITVTPDRDDYPEWFPDSHRIVYVSETGGRHDLYAVTVGP